MREFDEQTLTQAVLERAAGAPDPRLRGILESLIRHLHGFVREVRPSWEEWRSGIEFLTQTGQKCDTKRQEFILLSDTLGVSMLVDLLNYGKHPGSSESTVLGPFYVEGAPEIRIGGSIAQPGTPGETAIVSGSVKSIDGAPVADAVLDVWESGTDGLYDVQKEDGTNLRGRLRADPSGRFWFRAIIPTSYPVPTDGPVGAMLNATRRHPMRPGHLHFAIRAPGYRPLITHLFTSGDEYLDSDAVFAVKQSLVIEYERIVSAETAARFGLAGPFWRVGYDFVLVPEGK
jgi:hydroxyquinol 1,2-dioxygenase